MRDIVQHVAPNAFITAPGRDLALYPQSSSDDENHEEEYDEDGIPIPKQSKKRGRDKYAMFSN